MYLMIIAVFKLKKSNILRSVLEKYKEKIIFLEILHFVTLLVLVESNPLL